MGMLASGSGSSVPVGIGEWEELPLDLKVKVIHPEETLLGTIRSKTDVSITIHQLLSPKDLVFPA